ncbi:Fe-S oxidoreductase, partial [Sphingomonas sp. ABOLE]
MKWMLLASAMVLSGTAIAQDMPAQQTTPGQTQAQPAPPAAPMQGQTTPQTDPAEPPA